MGMQLFISKTEKLTQQQLLRYAIQCTGTTRKEFAELLAINPRRLNSWLLPQDSRGFRPMDIEYQAEVHRIMIEVQMEQQHHILDGEISPNVPIIHCELFDFNFPTIYRLTLRVHAVNQQGEPDPAKDWQAIEYSLTPNVPAEVLAHVSQSLIKAEPVHKRNSPDDWGWLYVSEHRSLDRAESYIDGMQEALMNPQFRSAYRTYRFGGRYFTLAHTDKPAGTDVKDLLTLYRSDKYFEMAYRNPDLFRPGSYILENEWRLVLDADGNETEPFDWEKC